jgi:GDP-4-dehydro-6-deoxy-D-mannose reductase
LSRVLVTGCEGFVGPYVIAALESAGHEVWGTDIKEASRALDDARYATADLSDPRAAADLLSHAAPDAVVHLAAQSSAAKSFGEPFVTVTQNLLPVLNVLEHARNRAHQMRILAVGSADVYGPVAPSDLPLTEALEPNPVNPYALSKVFQERCCAQYADLYGTQVMMTRSFNHTGSGQSDTFVLPSFARQVVEIKKGFREPVVAVGNIDVRRDFSDVRDVAAAYTALLDAGRPGETYNVCSGVSHSLRDLLETLCSLAGVAPEIRVDPKRIRPVDMEELRGDASKISAETGWRAAYSIEDTMKTLLDYWEKIPESYGAK